ncbi:hypothetical protein H4K35_09885 [Myroides sp. NP-2]|uniref:hypothetical protein n=1 Tax=Myroides sp. NP-2 TaxID=2759945 RepID=UPI0015F8A55D|nr:hypothetical protein [Myroides sp. NP-2]MBB1150424.1 hypothetical protein [Myroides sp. NP-2]
MTKYEKIKIILFIVAIVSFSIIGYLNSINGRYTHIVDSKMMLDTRTGDVLTLESKKKIN